jgi:uncharacterized protein (DUF934 family)
MNGYSLISQLDFKRRSGFDNQGLRRSRSVQEMTKHFDGLTNNESTNGSSRVQTPLRQRSNVDISETDNSNTEC